MIDFAKLNEETQIKRDRQGPAYPYKACDRETFDGKQLRSGKLTLTADFRRDMRSDDIIMRALDGKGQRVEVVFTGQRADDFKSGVGAALEEIHQTAILGDDFREGFEHRIDARMTGVFKKRNWKDGKGQWHFVWQFRPAVWTYAVLERGVEHDVTEGRLPSATYATVTQAAPAAA